MHSEARRPTHRSSRCRQRRLDGWRNSTVATTRGSRACRPVHSSSGRRSRPKEASPSSPLVVRCAIREQLLGSEIAAAQEAKTGEGNGEKADGAWLQYGDWPADACRPAENTGSCEGGIGKRTAALRRKVGAPLLVSGGNRTRAGGTVGAENRECQVPHVVEIQTPRICRRLVIVNPVPSEIQVQ